MESHYLPALFLSLFISSPLQAGIYQWTDEQGRVHYSDRPSHESAQEINLPSAPAATQNRSIPADRQKMRQRMLDVYEQERMEKREAAAKAKQERAERKRRCLNARANYENYSSVGSIYEYQESGERRYLDKQQRKRYLTKLKAEVAQYCD